MSSLAPATSIASISITHFHHLLSLYPATVSDVYTDKVRSRSQGKSKSADQVAEEVHNFKTLDSWRYEDLPTTLVSRGKESKHGKAWVDKAELEKAMEWKLKHGHARPFLPALIRQNAASTVETTTSTAFSAHTTDPTAYPTSPLKTLADLKGVGPATASLLLAVYDPDNVAFFSDEMLMWVCGERPQKIKYDFKEYREIWESVRDLRKRLGKDVRAVDVERVGFVVGNIGNISQVDSAEVEQLAEGDGRTLDEEEDNAIAPLEASVKTGRKRRNGVADDAPSRKSKKS